MVSYSQVDVDGRFLTCSFLSVCHGCSQVDGSVIDVGSSGWLACYVWKYIDVQGMENHIAR